MVCQCYYALLMRGLLCELGIKDSIKVQSTNLQMLNVYRISNYVSHYVRICDE